VWIGIVADAIAAAGLAGTIVLARRAKRASLRAQRSAAQATAAAHRAEQARLNRTR
jgi:hypothetical protein